MKMPNGYLTSDGAREFVQSYAKKQSVSGLDAILKGEIHSMKSHNPLFVVSDGNSEIPDSVSLMDLHNYILNIYNEE